MKDAPQPGQVDIPRSKLGQQLKQAADIKEQMTRLMSELEKTAMGHDTGKPGGWRREPLTWFKKHAPKIRS